MLTVIMEPNTKVESVLNSPTAAWFGPNRSFVTPGSSPTSTITGTSTTELIRFVYQERCSALPCTTSRLFLITTECSAVIMDEVTPKATPIMETSVPSRKTPTKKPAVTTAQAARMRNEGRTLRRKKEVPTVKGEPCHEPLDRKRHRHI